MLFLESSPAFEKAGKVLPSVLAVGMHKSPASWPLTLALAMLALRRFSRVETPTSECNMSCTRCCVCALGGALPWSGDVGVASSMGEARAPSCVGDDTLFGSAWTLSVPSIGGIAFGAAIADAAVVAGGNGCVAGSPSECAMPRASAEAEMLHGQAPRNVILPAVKFCQPSSRA